MAEKTLSEKVVDKMLTNDPFSLWMGMEVSNVRPGHCTIQMTVRREMLNGFGIAHGGITYALADSALAFASNGYGRMAVSVETSISHLEPVKEGDLLKATVEEKSMTNRIGVYYITVRNQKGKDVALFKGTVYRTSKDWQV